MNDTDVFLFRIYVAGDTQNSTRALANITALCRIYLPNRHRIEIVDILKDPKRAAADGVLMTPTLIKIKPLPTRRFLGTLDKTDLVLQALGLENIAV